MQAERCETCKWWDNERECDTYGRRAFCRRYPPVAVLPTFARWKSEDEYEPHDDPCVWSCPIVEPDEFCGEWTPRSVPVSVPG